jgi:hypothetical protein
MKHLSLLLLCLCGIGYGQTVIEDWHYALVWQYRHDNAYGNMQAPVLQAVLPDQIPQHTSCGDFADSVGAFCIDRMSVGVIGGGDTITITEPAEVPAIQVDDDCVGWSTDRDSTGLWITTCVAHYQRWTCADRSRSLSAKLKRILLTAEDGTKHCVKFQ